MGQQQRGRLGQQQRGIGLNGSTTKGLIGSQRHHNRVPMQFSASNQRNLQRVSGPSYKGPTNSTYKGSSGHVSRRVSSDPLCPVQPALCFWATNWSLKHRATITYKGSDDGKKTESVTHSGPLYELTRSFVSRWSKNKGAIVPANVRGVTDGNV
jgi:hypothetical protein